MPMAVEPLLAVFCLLVYAVFLISSNKIDN